MARNSVIFENLKKDKKMIKNQKEISCGDTFPVFKNLPCVGIIGKANVGKSTLFNRMSGRSLAITADYEGVTRDWQAYEGTLFDLKFTILDTPGLGIKDSPYEPKIKKILEDLICHCQCVVFLVDARQNISSTDQEILRWLRKQGKSILLVANKCERDSYIFQSLDFSSLGLGAPVPISALHGQGMWELKEALSGMFLQNNLIKKSDLPHVDTDSSVFCDQLFPNHFCDAPLLSSDCESTALNHKIRVAIVGRPNAGKSTFINACLGKDRLLTGPIAGITRDAIEVPLSMHDSSFIFVDTAGARKQAKSRNTLEQLSRGSGKKALIFSHVTLLCIDGTKGLEKQDLTLLDSIIEEGRAVAVGLTKWDQIEEPQAYLKSLRKCLDESIPSGRWIPLFPFSSLTSQGLRELCLGIKDLYIRWNRHITTGPLNRWLAECLQDTPPPLSKGSMIRLKYITQIKARPPRFVIFGNQVEVLPLNYRRYLLNRLVQAFHFEGVNPKIVYKTAKNPYDLKKINENR
ncbi:GTPase Der [Holospora obtusa F1]|uniref:GTPase Der n=1 Tax=Holospora obtusa F1 TaxID=1399147 RepID=W6TTU9_HOLOB|nr:ribosome biogenesis GTPase Der [Holospora obtusa]ETZ07217.1 GTPase Der [Holospora obtusa F1]